MALDDDIRAAMLSALHHGLLCKHITGPDFADSVFFMIHTHLMLSPLLAQHSADCACRPLSKAQQAYAQRDAHYLLYLAHVLYLELQAGDAVIPAKNDKSRVMQAWARCQRVSLSLYSKPSSQVTHLFQARLCFSRSAKASVPMVGSNRWPV